MLGFRKLFSRKGGNQEDSPNPQYEKLFETKKLLASRKELESSEVNDILKLVIDNSLFIYNSNYKDSEAIAQEFLNYINKCILKNKGVITWTEYKYVGVVGNSYAEEEEKSENIIKIFYDQAYKKYMTLYDETEKNIYVENLFNRIMPVIIGNNDAKFLDGGWLLEQITKNNGDYFFLTFFAKLYTGYKRNLTLTEEQNAILEGVSKSYLERKDIMEKVQTTVFNINKALENGYINTKDEYINHFVCPILLIVPNDPALLKNGSSTQYYDKNSLETSVKDRPVDPKTNVPINANHPIQIPDLKDYLGELYKIIDKIDNSKGKMKPPSAST